MQRWGRCPPNFYHILSFSALKGGVRVPNKILLLLPLKSQCLAPSRISDLLRMCAARESHMRFSHSTDVDVQGWPVVNERYSFFLICHKKTMNAFWTMPGKLWKRSSLCGMHFRRNHLFYLWWRFLTLCYVPIDRYISHVPPLAIASGLLLIIVNSARSPHWSSVCRIWASVNHRTCWWIYTVTLLMNFLSVGIIVSQ